MEWVETTAKTVDEARDAALDQLGVGTDDAEFDVIEEPRPGLFGRVRGEARVRARVKPAEVRPKQDRRRRSRSDQPAKKRGGNGADQRTEAPREPSDEASETGTRQETASQKNNGGRKRSPSKSGRSRSNSSSQEKTMNHEDRPESTVTPDEVGAAAVGFMQGLTDAFGAEAVVDLQVDGIELDVNLQGSELGLLVGPGGRTLNAVQDLARVAAQRRLGDHDTRLRIDVSGYRERRQLALGEFARKVAETVRTEGESRSLEPMTSADRKVVHDVLNDEDGVSTRSVGEDPDRRIVVEPA